MEAVIFIGIQASGKSSFYFERFANSHLRINLDMLRTRGRERIILDACIEAGQNIVIDNTNPEKKDRKRYISKLKETKATITGYYFNSSIKECLKRNSKRIGNGYIPEVGIKGTFNKLELPDYDEGFDQLYYVSIENNDFKVSDWKNEI